MAISLKVLVKLISVVLLLLLIWLNFTEVNESLSASASASKEDISSTGNPWGTAPPSESPQAKSKELEAFKLAVEKANSNPEITTPIQYPNLITAVKETEKLKVKDSGVSPFGVK